MYTVILDDGTKFENLSLNGNNFISSTEVTEDMFANNLSKVTISDGETIEVLNDVELIQISQMNDEWWFILREIPEDEKNTKSMEEALIDAQLAIAEVYELISGGEN